MTLQEATDYVNGLSTSDVCRLTATEIMGWTMKNVTDYTDEQISYWFDGNVRTVEVDEWCPDIDRNQSRMVTDKVRGSVTVHDLYMAIVNLTHSGAMVWCDITPDQETRAALIAHMIHKAEAGNE